MVKRPMKEFLSSSFNKETHDTSYAFSKRLSDTHNITNFSKISYYGTKGKPTINSYGKAKSRDINKLDVNRRAVTQKETQILK